LPAILEQINWIDIIFIILLLGMVYKGFRTGVGAQILSLVGSFVMVFLSIGYYIYTSEALFGSMLQSWTKPISFFAIVAVIFIAVKVLERVFNIIGGDELAMIERAGGAVVAAMRAVIICGLIGIIFLLLPIDYVRSSATQGSRACMKLVRIDIQIYSWMADLIHLSGQKDKDFIINEILTSNKQEPSGKE